MKIKKITGIFFGIMVLALSGCNNDSDKVKPELPLENTKSNDTSTNLKTDNDDVAVGEVDKVTEEEVSFAKLDQSLFEGKIQDMYYGNDNCIIVQADKIYLYDTVTGKVIGTAKKEASSDIKFLHYNGGYAGVWIENLEGGLMCVIYDEALNETDRIDLCDYLADDFIIDTTAISISGDGTKMVIASLDKVSIYDIDTAKFTKILEFATVEESNGLKLSDISHIAFVDEDKKLAFLGNSAHVPTRSDENNFPTYGTMKIDGTGLVNIENTAYTPGEMLVYKDFMFLPESFKNTSGTLLKVNFSDYSENKLPFSSGKEGKDGVYGSKEGKYFATAVLNDKATIRIYEQSSGKLLKEETIDEKNDIYFYRIPHILMLEDTRTCIVLLGCSQHDVETKVVKVEF